MNSFIVRINGRDTHVNLIGYKIAYNGVKLAIVRLAEGRYSGSELLVSPTRLKEDTMALAVG